MDSKSWASCNLNMQKNNKPAESSCIEVKVNGVDYKIDRDELLEIGDIDYDMGRIASDMAFWARVWAESEREKIQVEAHYRTWRARETMELLEADPKLAEWKAKTRVEADKKFLIHKTAQAQAAHNAVLCRGVFLSLEKKANLLQSKGAKARAEYEATGMSTKKKSKKVDAMKSNLAKSRKKRSS